MSFVFATRREPPIRLARLRAQGEVAELRHRRPALRRRRDRAALPRHLRPAARARRARRAQPPHRGLGRLAAARSRGAERSQPAQVRAFISSLSGAEGHLYDYLAEEVIGDLRPDLQQFLMRTSLLETVDLVLGPVAAGSPRKRPVPSSRRASDTASSARAGRAPATSLEPIHSSATSSRRASRRAVGDQGSASDPPRASPRPPRPIDWRIAASPLPGGRRAGDARASPDSARSRRSSRLAPIAAADDRRWVAARGRLAAPLGWSCARASLNSGGVSGEPSLAPRRLARPDPTRQSSS